MSQNSQMGKILTVMSYNPEVWYRPEDFMQNSLGDKFVGYEAHARLSMLSDKLLVEKAPRVETQRNFRPTKPAHKRMKCYKITEAGMDLVRTWFPGAKWLI